VFFSITPAIERRNDSLRAASALAGEDVADREGRRGFHPGRIVSRGKTAHGLMIVREKIVSGASKQLGTELAQDLAAGQCDLHPS